MSVSVIIPAYNRATLLPRTLDAALAQTVPPDEVIVVDDLTVNGGDLAARNIGLRAALGRLVAFCDSDDLWRPDFLASMLTLWQAEPRMRAAYADFVLVRDDVWDSNSKFAAAPAGYWNRLRAIGAEMGVFDLPVVDRLIRFQPFFQSCLVLHRQAFLAIGGWDEGAGRVVGADFATSLRLAEHPPLGVVRRPLVGVRKHAGNYSADVQAMNLGDARVLEYVLATRPGLRALAGPIRASIERRRLAALDTAFARRDFAAVVEIAALLSQPPPRLTDIKRRVAALPRPVRDITARALLAAGALRSTIYQRRAT